MHVHAASVWDTYEHPWRLTAHQAITKSKETRPGQASIRLGTQMQAGPVVAIDSMAAASACHHHVISTVPTVQLLVQRSTCGGGGKSGSGAFKATGPLSSSRTPPQLQSVDIVDLAQPLEGSDALTQFPLCGYS